MKLSEELVWRGFYKQSTLDNIEELDDKKVNFYHGFDASADSQTIGNLAGMMFNKVLTRHGHKCYILLGGATSLIGDPGGKTHERPLQDEEIIARNIARSEEQLTRIHDGDDITFVNNYEWIKPVKVIEFLRNTGKHYSMSRLIQREYISARIGDGGPGISYTEFSYGLLQGLDFLHLYDNYGVTLQLGTSDQWANCLLGVELVDRIRHVKVHTLTHPLVINRATGRKFGRSEPGTIWLDPKKTSVFRFYQFWLNTDDEGVEDYLKIYTTLDKVTIDRIMEESRQSPKSRLAQKTLAFETTQIVHGKWQADNISRINQLLFSSGAFRHLSIEDLSLLSQEVPVIQHSPGKKLIDIIAEGGLANSKSEASRLIKSHGIYLNGSQLNTDKENLEESDLQNGFAVLRRGKNYFTVVIK